METPQLDLASELLEVYKDEINEMHGGGGDGTSESAGEGGSEQNHYERSRRERSNSYVSAPRRAKAGLGQHRRKITKRTRFPMKWNHVRVFKESAEAEKFVQTFEGCTWRKGCNNKTSFGLKAYYICKESPLCKVMSLLHYDNKEGQVILFRSDRQHYHGGSSAENGSGTSGNLKQNGNTLPINCSNKPTAIKEETNPLQINQGPINGNKAPSNNNTNTNHESLGVQQVRKKIGGGRRRGLSDETIAIINDLYALDPHIKPSQVQEELKRHGIPLLQNYHINNFLVKLRKQSRLEAEQQNTQLNRRRSSHQMMAYDYSNNSNNGFNNGYYSDEHNNSSSAGDTWFNNPNPMSMVDIKLKNPFDEEDDEDEEFEEQGEQNNLMETAGDNLFDTATITPANNSSSSITTSEDAALIHGNDSVSVTISREPMSSTKRDNSSLNGGNRRNSCNSATSSGAIPLTSSTPSYNSFRTNQSEVVSTSNISRPRKRNFVSAEH